MDTKNFHGIYAELQFVLYATENKWEVAKPLASNVPYDALIRRSSDSPWETVQVKHAYYYTNGTSTRRYLCANMMRNGGRSKYKDGDFDWLFIYHKTGRWFMTWNLIKGGRGTRSRIQVESSKYDLWKV